MRVDMVGHGIIVISDNTIIKLINCNDECE